MFEGCLEKVGEKVVSLRVLAFLFWRSTATLFLYLSTLSFILLVAYFRYNKKGNASKEGQAIDSIHGHQECIRE